MRRMVFEFYGITLKANVIIKVILSMCYRQNLPADIKIQREIFLQMSARTRRLRLIVAYLFEVSLFADDLSVKILKNKYILWHKVYLRIMKIMTRTNAKLSQ
jgi:hypothetical protein